MKFPVLLSAFTAAGLIASTPATAEPSDNREGPSSPSAEADQADVVWRVVFRKGDQILGSPTVTGQFGREVGIEIAHAMRVIVVAEAPDAQGRSLTSASMAIFQDNAWQPPRVMSMRAVLSATPSFEYTVEGTGYRFVVMPRLVVPPTE